jgi:hypothetical protein
LARSSYKEDARVKKTLHRFEKAVTKKREIDAVRFSLSVFFVFDACQKKSKNIFYYYVILLCSFQKSTL